MLSKTIFNSSISTGSYQDFINEIFRLVEYKIPSYVCFANVHMLVEACNEASFQKVVNGANVVAPDGKPVSILLELLYKVRQERVCGMDILPDLLRQAEAYGKSVYFYGTTNDLLEAIVRKVRNEFPGLKVAGYFAPPFRNLSTSESSAITDKIREASPDLVFVALGCPKQEKWMAEHRDNLNACLLGFGQAFKVYVGREKRLPKWMRNLSMEWAYRLYLEPARLWKRYAYTNSQFLFLAAKLILSEMLRKYLRWFKKERLTAADPGHANKPPIC